MSQTYNLPVGSASVSTNLLTNVLNDLEALRSSFSGASAPTNPTPLAGQLFWDTSVGRLKMYDGVDWNSSIPRLDANETITGAWIFDTGITFNTSLVLSNTTADFNLLDGRDTYLDSGHASIYVSQAGAGDFASEAGHLVLQPRMVGGGVYRDIIFAGGNTTADMLMQITGEGNVAIGTSPATGNRLIVYAPNGYNSTDYIAHIKNDDVTAGQGQGLQIRAGIDVNDTILSLVKQDTTVKWEFKGNNETRTIDSLMIGSTSVTPDTTLHVYRGDSGGSSSTYSGLTVEDDQDVFLQILTPNVNVGGILFGDPQGSSVGQIRYDHASNNLSFYTNGGQQISINSSGQLVSSLTGSSPLVLSGVKTPVSATDTGTLGEVCRDANFLYVCTATNTWRRAALSSW